MALIELSAVSKIYTVGDQDVRALDGVSLQIDAGEYVAIVGTSGSGKSTLMNIMGCLDTPTTGAYRLNQRNVATMNDGQLSVVRNREIGFVFQSFNLLPRASALQNVMQPLVYRQTPKSERIARARTALETVGMAARAHHLPNQLSGGQRQRVAIARALCAEPSLIIADEPTGNLDSQTTRSIMELLDAIHAAGKTIILVTHEPAIAQRSGRIVRIEDGRVDTDQARA